MQIHIVTPGRMATRGGNRVTADRWGRILRALGHRVRITSGWHGEPTDLLVALHARKSASSVRRFRERHPDKPIVLALTGTDVYGDIATSLRARRSLSLASRLIVLQPLAAKQVPARYGPIVRVIYQSVPKPPRKPTPDPKLFQVCVLGHLRRVKDPFRAAKAVRGAAALQPRQGAARRQGAAWRRWPRAPRTRCARTRVTAGWGTCPMGTPSTCWRRAA